MRMHLILFSPNKEITLKEYLCDCNECINLNFNDCLLENKDGNVALDECEPENGDELDVDVTSNYSFEFIEVPAFVALVSGNENEPLYFVKIEEKGVSEKEMTDR